MIRKSLYDYLSGFEKSIFMYAEETLLCYRVLHETEFSIYNCPSAQIVHLEGGSFENGMNEFRAKCIADGNYIYHKIF